ncbi:MAG: MmgE/PrpD family protein [Alphaproteobacteria bacterium]|nr:MmgE/PrpD family protein [Alphaproteobacteria bacterium]
MSEAMSARSAEHPVPQEVTKELAAVSSNLARHSLSDDARAIARQCVMDWFAVTIAGSSEPAVRILKEEFAADGGAEMATLLGSGEKVPISHAALINGTASHALDYDDVHLSILGHPTVAVLPAIVALAEAEGRSGADLIAAFVAGYETACRVGELVGPAHYAHGFHATATIGSFGAAAAVAHLMKLDAGTTATAFGIAGTLASGLKSMFGTMCKPLHAGRAAENGLRAARLAARGFSSRPDVLECAQGFAATQSTDFIPEAAFADPVGGFHIRSNLFKYHASCYLTHAPIEAAMALVRDEGVEPAAVEHICIRTAEAADRVCNIANPRTGLEVKFSLRLTVALAVAGYDTAAFETYSDTVAAEPVLVRLRDRTEVAFDAGWTETQAEVVVTLSDGRTVKAYHDSGIPAADVVNQGKRIRTKFMTLTTPILGEGQAAELADAIDGIEDAASLGQVLELTQRAS